MSAHPHAVDTAIIDDIINYLLNELDKKRRFHTEQDATVAVRDTWCEWVFLACQYHTGFCFFGVSDATKNITSYEVRIAKSWPNNNFVSNSIILFDLLANRASSLTPLMIAMRDPLVSARTVDELKHRIQLGMRYGCNDLNSLLQRQGIVSNISTTDFLTMVKLFIEHADKVDFEKKQVKEAQKELEHVYSFDPCFWGGQPKSIITFLNGFVMLNYDQHASLTPAERQHVRLWTQRYLDRLYGVVMESRVVGMNPFYKSQSIENLVRAIVKDAQRAGIQGEEAKCQYIYERWAELALVACYYYCGLCFLGVSRDMTRMHFVDIKQRYPEGFFDDKTELVVLMYKLRFAMTSLSPLISHLFFTDLKTTKIGDVIAVLEGQLPYACSELSRLMETVGEYNAIHEAHFLRIMERMAYADGSETDTDATSLLYHKIARYLHLDNSIPSSEMFCPFTLATVETLTDINSNSSRQFSPYEKKEIRNLTRYFLDQALEPIESKTECFYLMSNRGKFRMLPQPKIDPKLERMLEYVFK